MNRHLGFTLLVLVASVTFAACKPLPQAGRPLQTEADFYGYITEVDPAGAGDATGRMLVERTVEQDDETYEAKYWVTVEPDIAVWHGEGEDAERAAFLDLKPGQLVRVWFAGPVRESYPAQVDARQVMIDSDAG
jgi:hypothetical protein